MAEAKNDYPTVIGSDAVFKGHLEFEKGVRLLGKFEGEIASKGDLLIEDGAELTGDVKAGTVRVDGQVKGNLDADNRIQLAATASLEGDITAPRLEVAEGAVFVGRCSVGLNGKSRPEGSTAKPASSGAPSQAQAPSKGKTDEPALAGAKK